MNWPHFKFSVALVAFFRDALFVSHKIVETILFHYN